jgi:hypothetical protein
MGKDAKLLPRNDVCCERFYGPGYERGNWPKIKQFALENESVLYGPDDGSIPPILLTQEVIEKLDRLWNAVGNQHWSGIADPAYPDSDFTSFDDWLRIHFEQEEQIECQS